MWQHHVQEMYLDDWNYAPLVIVCPPAPEVPAANTSSPPDFSEPLLHEFDHQNPLILLTGVLKAGPSLLQ